jgi:hypothetical protein
MSKRHPQNGPSFSKAPIKAARPAAQSPDRHAAELEETARLAARSKRFHQAIRTDPAVALDMLGLGKLKE